jgi:hypothetical protein
MLKSAARAFSFGENRPIPNATAENASETVRERFPP